MAKIANPLPGYKLGDGFGPRPVIIIGGKATQSYHGGRDIAAPAGTPVYAGGPGRVVYVQTGWYLSKGNHYVSAVRGRPIHDASAGNSIGIEYDAGFVITYSHASAVTKVNVGDRVGPNTEIMRVGSTGMSTGPHLHMTAFASLAAAYAWNRVNPDNFIDYNLRPSGATGGADHQLEGFLMALSDAEQKSLNEKVELIFRALVANPGTNQMYYMPQAIINELRGDGVAKAIAGVQGGVSNIQERLQARKADGTPWGFDYLPAINNSLEALTVRVGALQVGSLSEADRKALAASIVEAQGEDNARVLAQAILDGLKA